MSARRVAVLGAGKRVLETALPALRAAGDLFELAGVYARSARPIDTEHGRVDVRALTELEARGLDGIDLVYLAVGKDAVPEVLGRLAKLAPRTTDLLIETPVVRFRHFRHAARADAFRNAWVAEDCSTLPWLDTVRAAVEAGACEKPRAVWFDQSAYAYHAVATARALLGGTVRRGRRRKLAGRFALRELGFSGGGRAFVLEPRDYGSGRLVLAGARGSTSDFALDADGNVRLEVREREGRCTGFRIGAVETELDDAERGLCRLVAENAGVTARHEDMKRVGFLRLWREIGAGRGAYPLSDGLEDMVVDYQLEKLGRYLATPLTSPRWASGRAALSLLTRAGG